MATPLNKQHNKNLFLCKLKDFEEEERRKSSETNGFQNDCNPDNVHENEFVEAEVPEEVSKILK